MRPLLALIALLAATASAAQSTPAPAPQAPKALLLIWGGGKTLEEAEAAAQEYRKRSWDWKMKVLLLARGYPRILESGTVPGLEPGLHVVVLGVCEPKEGATLEVAFDALEPRTYSREVSWPEEGTLPCPRFGQHWSFVRSVRAKGEQGDLLAAFFSSTVPEGEFEMHGWHLVFTAHDKQGKWLSSRMESSGKTYSDLQQLEVRGDRLVMKERKLDPDCHHGSPRFEALMRTWSARLVGGKSIGIDRGTERTVEEGPCD